MYMNTRIETVHHFNCLVQGALPTVNEACNPTRSLMVIQVRFGFRQSI